MHPIGTAVLTHGNWVELVVTLNVPLMNNDEVLQIGSESL